MATTGALLSGSLNGGGEKEKLANSADGVTPTVSSTAGSGGFHLEFIERCLEHEPNHRANVEELLSRLGLPEPEKHDDTSMDEDGFLEDHQNNARLSHEPTPVVIIPERAASSPPQEPAPNIDKSKAMPTTAANTQKQAPTSNIVTNTKQDGYNVHFTTITPSTTTTNTTVAAAVSSAGTVVLTTAPASITTTTITNTLLPHPQNAAIQDEGYHTNQSINEAPGQSIDSSVTSEKSSVAPHQQHRETRQIMQMHAEVLDQGGYQLRIQLQLDDHMNRQLTAPLKEEDTAETLSEELVQHGFVSESNSVRMRELLVTLLNEFRSRKLEKAERRISCDSAHNPTTIASSTASSVTSPVGSTAQSPKHQYALDTTKTSISSSSTLPSKDG
uniref:LisH domain-containing protein n=1 Tax=Meloidogyne hapla TaxID=6305 RepID=A0A1I8BYJ0_MELHA